MVACGPPNLLSRAAEDRLRLWVRVPSSSILFCSLSWLSLCLFRWMVKTFLPVLVD
jgi:hypothetical protein